MHEQSLLSHQEISVLHNQIHSLDVLGKLQNSIAQIFLVPQNPCSIMNLYLLRSVMKLLRLFLYLPSIIKDVSELSLLLCLRCDSERTVLLVDTFRHINIRNEIIVYILTRIWLRE